MRRKPTLDFETPELKGKQQ